MSRFVSDPHGDAPHPDHPDEEDFFLEMPEEHAEAAEETHEHHDAGEQHPFDALGIHASTEEFHFTGPAEELDFTEPADFTFPTEQAPGEAVSESSTNLGAAEHVEGEHFFGSEEAAPHEATEGEELSIDGEAEAVPDLDLGEEEEVVKPKRELPAWVHTLQWSMVGLLGAGSLIAIFVGIIWIQNPDTVTLILNICCPLMILLIPFALWRSADRWVKPAVTALYTVMLALSVVALIGGTWAEGTELSHFKWQFNKARVAAGKPRPGYIPAPPPPPPAANDAVPAK